MRLLRSTAVFVLCAIVSLIILDTTLLLLGAGTATADEIVTGSLIFLPFIIVGGLVFGSLLLLTTQEQFRANVRRMVLSGTICGLFYSAIILFSFGAIVSRSLYLVAASGIAGAVSGLLWSKLVEQYA